MAVGYMKKPPKESADDSGGVRRAVQVIPVEVGAAQGHARTAGMRLEKHRLDNPSGLGAAERDR